MMSVTPATPAAPARSTAYIVVAGGVMSGVGKGVFSASLARALQTLGLRAGIVKLDPYLNQDAGLMSPYQHGEVFVLADGREADLDLGTYERALDTNLPGSASITSGLILARVLARERNGEYLGATVQYRPHVTDEYLAAIAAATAAQGSPDVCVIEVGGTPCDPEASVVLDSMRELLMRHAGAVVQVVHLPKPHMLGEFKTKPAQNAISRLRKAIVPDLVACRAETLPERAVLAKVASAAAPGTVCAVPDLDSVYDVPGLLMYGESLSALGSAHCAPVTVLLNRILVRLDAQAESLRVRISGALTALDLKTKNRAPAADVSETTRMALTYDGVLPGDNSELARAARLDIWGRSACCANKKRARVALIAKYSKLRDAYLSLNIALQCAAFDVEFVDAESLEDGCASFGAVVERAHNHLHMLTTRPIDPVCAFVIAGGFGTRAVEGKIAACVAARRLGVPTLAICLGMQAMAVAAVRAGAPEAVPPVAPCPGAGLDECGAAAADAVVAPMRGCELGGQLRCGAQPVVCLQGRFRDAYKKCAWAACEEFDTDAGRLFVLQGERFRHRHAIALAWIDRLAALGVRVTATTPVDGGDVPAVLEWDGRAWFVGVQFHPEYTSRPTRPHPLFVALYDAASAQYGSAQLGAGM